MRRLLSAVLIVGCLALLPSGALAAKLQGCTNSMTPIALNVDWEPVDGVPDPGDDAWWDMTLLGFAAEDLTLAEAAELFGQPSIEVFYEFILNGVLALDENGNGTICFKPFPPQQNGTPLYFFLASDDKVR